MFSCSLSYKVTSPNKSKSNDTSSESKEEQTKDSYVQGYNYHWELNPLEFPYVRHSISEVKADGMD
tara:strand:+ start:540 stop:737 length:198 start_codon:yes stop_codon:yes gene_type:complete